MMMMMMSEMQENDERHEMMRDGDVPELWLDRVWVCPLVCVSSSLESSSSSSSSSSDAQARSLASAMANCSATPVRNTCSVDEFSG